MLRAENMVSIGMSTPFSIEVLRGDVALVCGPNGSGKTTVLRHLCGLSRLKGSVVTLCGVDVFRQMRCGHILYVGHKQGVYPQLTFLEQLLLFCGLHKGVVGGEDREKSLGVLERMGLCAYQSISKASEGEKKRLGLAKLLLLEATLWVLDEPFSSLDKAGRVLLGELLESHREKGNIGVVAEHYVEEFSWDRRFVLGEENV